ncbi:DNA methyltransferase [Lactococcus lactis RTB018]|uniref:Cytosine-specific methyltransferase n=1 Tax=Lactococcus lactis subsp. lactis TaxID=1360 RepID=A0A1V0NG26_LACLL|nr:MULTISPECIES: DNA cytosine methyltransferase [Lactococcus]ARD98853.1 DNA (cytosine-5-)-methyltransferase [Lactococcus lactis subsp. lactis]NHI69388.1 DNA cytosine methyltransferase [Lactococcus garvieae]NHJ06457.1 DNA cytosine methyltransferase [Lactococcus garvieae]OAZ17113.1 DNA methyltransferase [Lactococcus lactis RTB018]
MNNNNYTVIDLFSGAGGLSQGFVQAGFQILAGIDFDEAALKTYEHNIRGAKALHEDLFDEEKSIKDIEVEIGSRDVDVIIAGPPCQGFSLTGSRDLNDSRNKLYVAVVHAVNHFKPKAFMIENVPGMATLYKGAVKQQIINTFEDLGYAVSVTEKPLFAADFGVPQTRKRMFFVGFRKDLGYDYFEFPKPKLSPDKYIGTAAAISDLPSLENDLGENVMNYPNEPQSDYQKLMRKNSKQLYNHVGTKHTDEVKWVISQVPEGGNYKDLPDGVGESRKFNEAWTRYHSQRPSKTIDTGHRNHFHYKWNRVPTVRENARLQSFPDNYEFIGTKTQQNRQVGNAVPPILAQAIGEKMRQHLDSIFAEKESNEKIK